ncbi:hypothetical protein [Halocatena marina]|uniref:Uncharacterized protein n=1 Tax=Halocatena marina TaxID=2934937 RepID=A0ABD5YXC2_9EURY|nr:hypothetical protein [Halocatena marina]
MERPWIGRPHPETFHDDVNSRHVETACSKDGAALSTDRRERLTHHHSSDTLGGVGGQLRGSEKTVKTQPHSVISLETGSATTICPSLVTVTENPR